MKEFHITITDNETGETIHDSDTNAIVGSILDDDGVFVIGQTHCNGDELLNAVIGAERAIEQLYENNPVLFFLKMMAKKETKEEATDETTEN